MAESNSLSFKLDTGTNDTLEQLAAKQHITKSALIRKLIDTGLQQELAKESVDFVREQIHDEIATSCFPQFERLAKLISKIGYQSVSTFYLLSYIMDSILPVQKQQEFNEVCRKAKASSVAYLKLSEKDFSAITAAENASVKKLGLS